MLGALLGTAVKAGFGFLGAKRSEKHAQKMFNQNAALQRQFARQGIQWRVADARAAGIHPLAALGASTHSASPVALGADHSGISSAGQDFSRAMQTGLRSRSAQVAHYNAQVRKHNLRNLELRNALLASQIARNTQAGQVPRTGMEDSGIVAGQPDSNVGRYAIIPQRVVASMSGRPGQEPRYISDVGLARTPSGGYAPVMSHDVKQRLDDDWPGMLWWNVRNRVKPWIMPRANQPRIPEKAGRGYRWAFSPSEGAYMRYRRKRRNRMYGVPPRYRRW